MSPALTTHPWVGWLMSRYVCLNISMYVYIIYISMYTHMLMDSSCNSEFVVTVTPTYPARKLYHENNPVG